MSREIEDYRGKKYSGHDTRIFKEWEMMDQRYRGDKQCEYIIRKRNGAGLPIVFDIIFNIKSIIGVEEADDQGLQKPIFGNEHIMRIKLPNNYPDAHSQPEFDFTTNVWHPNIQYSGDFKGHVCLNTTDHGVYTSLVTYIDRVIDYLTYEDYLAKNEYPYPQDLEVAEWVLTQAEPQGWIPFTQN